MPGRCRGSTGSGGAACRSCRGRAWPRSTRETSCSSSFRRPSPRRRGCSCASSPAPPASPSSCASRACRRSPRRSGRSRGGRAGSRPPRRASSDSLRRTRCCRGSPRRSSASGRGETHALRRRPRRRDGAPRRRLGAGAARRRGPPRARPSRGAGRARRHSRAVGNRGVLGSGGSARRPPRRTGARHLPRYGTRQHPGRGGGAPPVLRGPGCSSARPAPRSPRRRRRRGLDARDPIRWDRGVPVPSVADARTSLLDSRPPRPRGRPGRAAEGAGGGARRRPAGPRPGNARLRAPSHRRAVRVLDPLSREIRDSLRFRCRLARRPRCGGARESARREGTCLRFRLAGSAPRLRPGSDHGTPLSDVPGISARGAPGGPGGAARSVRRRIASEGLPLRLVPGRRRERRRTTRARRAPGRRAGPSPTRPAGSAPRPFSRGTTTFPCRVRSSSGSSSWRAPRTAASCSRPSPAPLVSWGPSWASPGPRAGTLRSSTSSGIRFRLSASSTGSSVEATRGSWPRVSSGRACRRRAAFVAGAGETSCRRAGEVLRVSDRPSGLELEVRVAGPEPAYLLVCRPLAATGAAVLDGSRVVVDDANFGFSGLAVPKGHHVLQLRPHVEDG